MICVYTVNCVYYVYSSHNSGMAHTNGNGYGSDDDTSISGAVGGSVTLPQGTVTGSTTVNDNSLSLRRDMNDDCGLHALQQSMRGSTGASATTRRKDDEVYQSICYVTFKVQVPARLPYRA